MGPINPIHLLILHALLGGGRPWETPGSGLHFPLQGLTGGMGSPGGFDWRHPQPMNGMWNPQAMGGAGMGPPSGQGQSGTRSPGGGFDWRNPQPMNGMWNPQTMGGAGMSAPSGQTRSQFQPGMPNNSSAGGASNHLQSILALLNGG